VGEPTPATREIVIASQDQNAARRLRRIADILDRYDLPEAERYRNHANQIEGN